MSKPVRIYVTTYCGYCTMAKRFFDSVGIDYESIDVTGDTEQRNWLVQETGQRTVPQIFVGDEPIGGYTDMMALHRTGELATKLGGVGVELQTK